MTNPLQNKTTIRKYVVTLLCLMGVLIFLPQLAHSSDTSEYESAEGGDFLGPACLGSVGEFELLQHFEYNERGALDEIFEVREHETSQTSGTHALTSCASCHGKWHVTGSRGGSGTEVYRFTCGDADSRARAINDMLSDWGIYDMCSGACPAGKWCGPTGVYSATSDGVQLDVDDTAPVCSYQIAWGGSNGNGFADFTPKACECI